MTMDGWSLHVARHGDEDQPVVVIDGFAPEPERFRDDAGFLSFRAMGRHYPGVRAPVAPAMLRPLLDALAPVAREVFGVTALTVVDSFYSLVTTEPRALAPIQRLPHFDEVSPTRLALLHYLAPDDRSGTAFFRHRASGWESVNAARLDRYAATLAQEVEGGGLPPAGYIAGDTPLFRQIARHDGRFNRAILYRSNSLHCAAIPADMALSADPLAGRLTVNTFLDGHSVYAPTRDCCGRATPAGVRS